MKLTEQASSPAKAKGLATKSKIAKKTKPVSRRRATPATASVRAASKRPGRTASTFTGYSDSAARLIARGKTALGDAYTWVGETGSALPKATRQLNLPDQKSLQAMIEDKPLIIGAVGLGIGVALGAMLPSATKTGNGKRTPSRPSRRK